VTNLELALLLGVGFVIGRGFFGSPWLVGALLLFALPTAWCWWRGFCGLDQWPHPYGRYYVRRLGLGNAGDYYPWLAKQMHQQEPWAAWARLEADND
jgi:hypothetical protein